MDNSTNEEIKRAIKRTDSFMERAALLLHTGKKGQPFPPNTEFSELELQSYENSLLILAVKLLRTPEIPESIWIPPIKYSYKCVEGERRTEWTWLERFHMGLSATKEFFNSFISDVPTYESYRVEIKDSTGVAVSFNGSSSSVDLVNSLNSNELQAISNELQTLREALRTESRTASDDIAIGHIALAENAAKNNDKKGIIENLKKAGTWVFDVATKIGVSVTSKIIGDLIKTNS